MTDNSRKVFEFLKENHGIKMTGQEVAQKLGVTINAVTGSVNGLVKKKYAERIEEVQKDENGKDTVVKYITLTEAGMAFDPDAVVEKQSK